MYLNLWQFYLHVSWFVQMISWFVQLNSWFDPIIWFVLKYTPNWCLICCSLTSTGPKNYQTIPNQLKIEIWTENINLNNFYPWQHHDFWPYFRVTKSDFRFFKFFQTSRARLKKKFSWAKTLGHCELKSRISGS